MSLNFKLVGDKELQLYLKNLNKNINKQIISGLDDIGDHLHNKVKDRIGNYHPSWPKLKRASVIAKYRRRTMKGAASRATKGISFNIGPDEPLILFGDLKKSISKELNIGSKEVVVYSDAPHAAVHEYGYAPKNIPSRSYMRTTLWDETDEVVNIMNRKIGKII